MALENTSLAYHEKFNGFLTAILQAKKDKATFIFVPSPQTLSDDYGELIESLNRIAEAGLSLQIVPRSGRNFPDYSRGTEAR